jgi:hypothetical protein
VAISVAGPSAELIWVYRRAATLGRWSLRMNPSTGGALSAHIDTIDDTYGLSQRPLVFRVTRPSGVVWRWPVTELQIAGETLTASLGPQE